MHIWQWLNLPHSQKTNCTEQLLEDKDTQSTKKDKVGFEYLYKIASANLCLNNSRYPAQSHPVIIVESSYILRRYF